MLSESLCYNSFIKISNKAISQHFFRIKNILVGDLFDDEGNTLPWLTFREKYDLHENLFFNWRQIIDAIPINWKKMIKNDNGASKKFMDRSPHLIYHARILPLDKLTSKELYKILFSPN